MSVLFFLLILMKGEENFQQLTIAREDFSSPGIGQEQPPNSGSCVLWAGWFILEELYPHFLPCVFFNIQVWNLWSFQKFQCFLQLNLIYSLVYSNLSSILLTFFLLTAFYKTPHLFYRLVYAGNLFRGAGKILPIQGWFLAIPRWI